MNAPRGEVAVVTGASSGIGYEIARVLAPSCRHLTLVARRGDRLNALAEKLAREDLTVHTVVLDLALPGAAQCLYEQIRARGVVASVLVNCAATAVHRAFVDTELSALQRLMQLNVGALTELTLLCARDMAQARRGRILQVASMGAYQPTPYNASYAASKSFVGSLSEALSYELRGSGVTVTTVYPGKTDTELHLSSGAKDPAVYERAALSAEYVAATAVREMFAGRESVAIGTLSAIAQVVAKLVPRPWFRDLVGRVMKESLA